MVFIFGTKKKQNKTSNLTIRALDTGLFLDDIFFKEPTSSDRNIINTL